MVEPEMGRLFPGCLKFLFLTICNCFDQTFKYTYKTSVHLKNGKIHLEL